MSSKKAYLVASAFFLILLIFSLFIGLFFYNNTETLKQNIIASKQTTASITAAAIQVKISHLVNTALLMASNNAIITDVVNNQWEKAANITRDLQNDNSYYDTFIDRIVLFDVNGIEQAAYPALTGGIGGDFSNVSYIQGILGGAPYIVSNVVRRASRPQINIINVAVPIAAQGKIIGIVEFQIPTTRFLEFDSGASMETYGFTYIIDSAGNIVADPRITSEEGNIMNVSSTLIAQSVLSGNAGYNENYSSAIGNEKSFIAYAPVSVYKWGVILQEPYNELFSNMESIARVVEIGLFMFILFSCAVSYLVFRLLNRKKKSNG